MTTNTQFPAEGKMRVTPEQSRRLQKRLFREGYRWNPGITRIAFIAEPYLIWYKVDKRMTYTNDDDHFYHHVLQPEYKFSDLFPEQSEPFDIAGGIVDIITILKNTKDEELVKKVLEMIKK